MSELKIKSAQNGYALEKVLTFDDGKTQEILDVIEEPDDENGAMKRMLERVAEHFGYTYNKFGNENLVISFTGKGHKVE